MPVRRFRPVLLLVMLLLSGCAGLVPGESVRVSVADLEPLQGEGLEARFAVKLRIQNPNDRAVSFDGISVELELADKDFGSGVSDYSGTIPRFGETVVSVPMTVPFTAMVRQLFGLAAAGDNVGPVSYRLRGRLGGIGLGGIRFDKRGEIDLQPERRSR